MLKINASPPVNSQIETFLIRNYSDGFLADNDERQSRDALAPGASYANGVKLQSPVSRSARWVGMGNK